jgi:hypothetical protein
VAIMKIKENYINLTIVISLSVFSLISLSPLSAKEVNPVSPAVVQVYNSIYQVGFQNPEKAMELASLISTESKKYKIDPKVMVAIIMVESNFKQEAISRTGDISMAQINIKTWSLEFKRLKRVSIDEQKMHNDKAYAISRMAEILSILSRNHTNKKDWFASYHSKTPDLKKVYYEKLLVQIKKMKPVSLALNQKII